MKKSLLLLALITSSFTVALIPPAKKSGNTTLKRLLPQPSLLHVEGKSLKDDCGESIILKGVNMGSIYDAADFGTLETAQVAQTGANAMRLVLETYYCTFPPPNYNCLPHPTTSAQIQPMIQACLNSKLIPIVELHDYTGTSDPMTALTLAANWCCLLYTSRCV